MALGKGVRNLGASPEVHTGSEMKRASIFNLAILRAAGTAIPLAG